MAKKKTQCPYCGKLYISLARHKCKLAPNSEMEEENPHNTNSTNDMSRFSGKKKLNYSEIDKEVLVLVKKNQEIYKDEILESLNIDEKLLVNSINRLKTKQKIQIKSDLVEGIRKDLVKFIEEYKMKTDPSDSNKNPNTITWETMGNCPCFLCPNVEKCNLGQNETNPVHCQFLVDWINCRLSNTHYENPFKGNIEDKKK
ncbi:MAG: hypothetical protein JW776_14820 [Candidatus Lokiarchaeota archaeon]|nr:hypothetical protein [Candidatus Lokiarchaeota archaeon]